MKMDHKFIIGFFLILSIVHLQAQTDKEPETYLQKWDVTLSVSSLETILLHPDKILENPDAFWETDTAYKLVKSWHQSNKIPMDTKNYYENWLAFLRTQADIPEEERQNNSAFRLLKEIQSRIPIFQSKSIPLLNEFIPKNRLRFKTTIHITGKTYPFAMMHDGQIMADALSKRFDNDADKIFNILTHECFHIGYGFNRYLRKEMELDNDFIYNTMLDALHNEGLATYVGYKAKETFPLKEFPDYQMLDSFPEVKRQLVTVNNLFKITDSLTLDSLRKVSWEVGINQRGYYVVGAYMARTIDQQMGRRALLETIVMGPLNFVDTYNDLVTEDMKVVTFKKPTEVSLVHKLKTAIENGDQAEYEKVFVKMKAEKEELPSPTQQRLERLGYGMIYQESFEQAIEIFKLDVGLFPKSANSYDCLAEAYMKAGNNELAIKNYKKSLELNPKNDNAKNMLEQLHK